MVNGLMYAEDVINAGKEFKIGDFVKFNDNFDNRRVNRGPYKAQVVGIYPFYILLEVFGKAGNFLISCNKTDLVSTDTNTSLKHKKLRKKFTHYNAGNAQ